MRKVTIRKSVWLPILITIYFIGMAFYFGKEMLATGQQTRFLLISGIEIVVIIAMTIFLRKRENITRK